MSSPQDLATHPALMHHHTLASPVTAPGVRVWVQAFGDEMPTTALLFLLRLSQCSIAPLAWIKSDNATATLAPLH